MLDGDNAYFIYVAGNRMWVAAYRADANKPLWATDTVELSDGGQADLSGGMLTIPALCGTQCMEIVALDTASGSRLWASGVLPIPRVIGSTPGQIVVGIGGS